MKLIEARQAYGKLGILIRQKRNEKGVTQVDLAAALNIDRSHVTRIESGKKPVSVVRLLEISKALECQASDLIAKLEVGIK